MTQVLDLCSFIFQTSMLIVDDAISDFEMVPDIYMSKTIPSELPYKKARLEKLHFLQFV